MATWPGESAAGLLPSVAQPPLPLQEFLPLQPLSPVLQPPLPLQEFKPLQAVLVRSVFVLVAHLERNTSLRAGWTGVCGNGKRTAHQAGNRCTGNHCFLCHCDLSFSLLFLPNFQTAQYRREPGKGLKMPKACVIRRAEEIGCIGWELFDIRVPTWEAENLPDAASYVNGHALVADGGFVAEQCSVPQPPWFDAARGRK